MLLQTFFFNHNLFILTRGYKKIISSCNIKQSFQESTNSLHRWHGGIRPIKTQQGNSCNLKSMCLEGLEIYPVVLPTKRNLLYPTLLGLIIKKKRGKLKTSADSTQEQNFSKYRKWIQVQQKITSILDRVYSGEAEEFIDLYNIRLWKFGFGLIYFGFKPLWFGFWLV